MGRSRTADRRKERQKQKRREQQRNLLIGGVVLIIAAAVVFFIINQPAEAPIPEGAVATYSDILQSTTTEGYPLLGNPDAPARLKEYSSFDCSSCKIFHDNVVPPLIDRIRSGELAFIYVPLFGTGSISGGEGAALSAVCAAQQDTFWPYHDTLFSWQGLYANQAFTTQRLAAGINSLGLDRAAYDSCRLSQTPRQVLDAALAEAGSQSGFSGTPFVTINGTAVTADLGSISTAIDQAVAQAGGLAALVPGTIDAQGSVEATIAPAAETTPEAEATADMTEAVSEPAAEATAESTEASG